MQYAKQHSAPFLLPPLDMEHRTTQLRRAGIPNLRRVIATAAPALRSPVDPLVLRVSHWVNVLAILVMATSGWHLYNASPFLGFKFPSDLTLAGELGSALQWHFAALWLLAGNGLIYLVYGLASGNFRRKLRPRVLVADVLVADLLAVGRGLLVQFVHQDFSIYHAAQHVARAILILALIALLLSGLAVWKSLSGADDEYGLAVPMGGYEGARRVHFSAMALIVLSVVVHAARVLLLVLASSAWLSMMARRRRIMH